MGDISQTQIQSPPPQQQTHIIDNQKSPLQKRKFPAMNNYLKVFLICLGVSFAFFIPFIVYEGGYFLYYGDFNVQQIPFYTSVHDAVKNGELFWDWTTDLGTNFIASYSFYLLTSPFFWLTLVFPNAVVPYLLAPLLMLKFACAGVTGYAFIKRFSKRENFAILGAVMYAFCGFNIYNIFFNHFHEAVVIFPLMLVALEELVINDRKGVFALAVFAGAFINYFFFFGQVVFIAIYFFVRWSSGDYKMNVKKFLFVAIEAVIGLLMSSVILLPSILAILSNYRVNEFLTGLNILVYPNEQRYALILESMFFPPDIPSRPNFLPDANSKWSSVSLYLPFFSMTGIVVFLRNKTGHWLKKVLVICGIMAFVPILNSMFYAFNSSYYARWFYMPCLMMSLATCLSLEDEKIDFSHGVKVVAGFVFGFACIGIIPVEEDGVLKWFSFPQFPERFWAYVAISAVSLILIVVLLKMPRHQKAFINTSIVVTCVITVCYSTLMIGTGKSHSNYSSAITEQGIHGMDNMTMPDPKDEFYRIDNYETLDNINMYWNLPSINCFHSVVPSSIMEFYDLIGGTRDVASRNEPENKAVRALTSTKYQFVYSDEEEEDREITLGFEYLKSENGFDIYENKHFIPMGFTYDYYVADFDFEGYVENNRDSLLLHAMYISDEDAEKYGYLLQEMDNDTKPDLSDAGYYADCEARRLNSAYHFEYGTSHFLSKIELEKPNLVFYSVPYEDGWSATVNGEEVEIIKANIGFMAVEVPAGDNQIIFTYETPGLHTGYMVTIIAIVVLMGYVWISHLIKVKSNAKKTK